MCSTLSITTVKARKPHKCCWCGQGIAAGERYTAAVVIGDDSGPERQHWHLECSAAFQRELHHPMNRGEHCVYFDWRGQQRGETVDETQDREHAEEYARCFEVQAS